MLVRGGVHIAAELVGGEPKLGLETDYSAIALRVPDLEALAGTMETFH